MLKCKFGKAITWLLGLLVLLGSFVFFQCFYTYHLYYREQTQLFLYTSEYLSTYFQHPAWLACITGDFLTQFFYYIGGGAAILALLLTLIYWLSWKALRNYLSNWLSLALGVGFAFWELLRNCEQNYLTSSTIALIGGIGMFLLYALAAKSILKNRWLNLLVVIICLFAGYWLFGYGAWNLVDLR